MDPLIELLSAVILRMKNLYGSAIAKVIRRKEIARYGRALTFAQNEVKT